MIEFKIYNEDCVSTMKRMQDDFVDLVVTSPPYDSLRSYKDSIDKTWNFEKFKTIAMELYRTSKMVVWVVGDSTINGSETGTSFRQALYFMELGYKLHDTMIYHKINPVPLKSTRYNPSFEYMFVFSKCKNVTFNPIMEPCKDAGKIKTNRGKRKKDGEMGGFTGEGDPIKDFKIKNNIWSYVVGYSRENKIAHNHPAIFPEKLAEDHILSWSNKNDVIYDPFCGSGTTGKMALLNNRKFIGSEISSEYCEIANKRISSITSLEKFFD